jgi:hypothetical protein
MDYPVWPANLPHPLRDGFSVEGTQPVHRQAMESGPDRVTRISSTTMRTNPCSIICDRQQVAEFWSFYEHGGNAGADWVIIPMVTGNAVAPHLCRFVGHPSQVPDGLDWRITFVLETAEQQFDWSV